MTTYEVNVTRDDGTWAAVVDGMPPHVIGATDVEHFADLEPEVRDLVAALTEADLYGFNLKWRVVINDRDVIAEILALGDAQAALNDALAAHENARRAALKTLAGAGLSQAAIGDVLGLSRQRVHQLIKAS